MTIYNYKLPEGSEATYVNGNLWASDFEYSVASRDPALDLLVSEGFLVLSETQDPSSESKEDVQPSNTEATTDVDGPAQSDSTPAPKATPAGNKGGKGGRGGKGGKK